MKPSHLRTYQSGSLKRKLKENKARCARENTRTDVFDNFIQKPATERETHDQGLTGLQSNGNDEAATASAQLQLAGDDEDEPKQKCLKVSISLAFQL